MLLPLLLGQGTGAAAYSLNAEVGSYSLSGQSATLARTISFTASSGSFTLTGQDATLTYTPVSRILVADSSSYSLTGQDVSAYIARVLKSDAGSFSISGQAATLTTQYKGTLDAGSYTLSGQSTSLYRTYVENFTSGSYSITGQDANLSVTAFLGLNAEVGSYSLSGQDISVSRVYLLTAQSATDSDSYVVTDYVAAGYDSNPAYSILSEYVEPGYVNPDYVGTEGVTFILDRVLSAESGTYQLFGGETAGIAPIRAVGRTKVALAVVEYDGKQYRLPVEDVYLFLDAIKEESKVPKPVKVKRKKGRKTLVVEDKKPKVVLISAPREFSPMIQTAIDRTNEILEHIWRSLTQRLLNELDDEEALLLLL